LQPCGEAILLLLLLLLFTGDTASKKATGGEERRQRSEEDGLRPCGDGILASGGVGGFTAVPRSRPHSDSGLLSCGIAGGEVGCVHAAHICVGPGKLANSESAMDSTADVRRVSNLLGGSGTLCVESSRMGSSISGSSTIVRIANDHARFAML